ncbi:MAG TPA: hypothetical protein ENN54_06405 [Thermoplasmatales archaeon]|nr:hypothetical protein [Candidatus Thermoplasmatota archaeon]MDD5778172.1 hypothetical protein [Candidatus Thermoplasmatota archaeon]HDS59901.1 hypothetical protein [Thermoplasmatales archaeon]
MQPDRDEQVLLERRASIRGRRLRAVGTLTVTSKKLSFRPLARERSITVSLTAIQDIRIVGLLFKKLRISTRRHVYVLYVKGADNLAGLLRTLLAHLT